MEVPCILPCGQLYPVSSGEPSRGSITIRCTCQRNGSSSKTDKHMWGNETREEGSQSEDRASIQEKMQGGARRVTRLLKFYVLSYFSYVRVFLQLCW